MLVTPCAEFTVSQCHEDAQLIERRLQRSGQSCQCKRVRTRKSSRSGHFWQQAPMIRIRLCAACLGTKQFCRQKGVVLQQMTKQVNCSSTASTSIRKISREAGGNFTCSSEPKTNMAVGCGSKYGDKHENPVLSRESESTDPAARSRLSQRGWSKALEKVQRIHQKIDARQSKRPLHDELVGEKN